MLGLIRNGSLDARRADLKPERLPKIKLPAQAA